MRSVLLMIMFVSIVFAGTSTQTDWSGGDGVQGPVFEWSDTFWSKDDNVICSSGKLQLSGLIPPVEHTVDQYLDGAISVYSADVDGDGDMDVLGAAIFEITWFENVDGTGTTWIEHTIEEYFAAAKSVFSADVDGDGDADVLGASYQDNDITWWENTDGTGATWVEHAIDGNYPGAYSVYATDIDGDGDADVLGAAAAGARITWWENADGVGLTWIEHTVNSYFNTPFSVSSADVDGDGDADVLGAAYLGNDITWWENADGTGTTWTEHTVDGNFSGASSVFSSDVDGDGDADILGSSNIDDDITWWENADGTGSTWTEHLIDGDFSGAYFVYSTDLDSDGDADVIGAAALGDDISWWENIDSAGTIWTEHIVDEDYDGASSVYAADVNADGSLDILGAAKVDDVITWWDVIFSPTGTLESAILDAGDVAYWNIFLSSSDEPAGTSVSFQFRSSDDFSDMGVWSDTVFSPDTPLAGLLSDSTRYLQYKVILETSDPEILPELAEVAFSYTLQVGLAESGSSEVAAWSLSTSENPSAGFLTAVLSVPFDASVELWLHDVCGRVIAKVSEELPVGTHSVSFSELSEGVYFCTMRAGNFSATQRVVVVN